MIKTNKNKLLVVIPLAALIAFLGVLSFQWMLADIYYHQAKRYVTRWEKSGEVDSVAKWERARELATTAQSLHWANPIIQHELGRIHEWYSFAPKKDYKALTDYLAVAEGHYQRAIHLRPNYPYTWGAFAVSKVRRGIVDEELAEAITRIREIGPYEQIARKQAVTAGLASWPRLDQRTREILLELIVLGLDRQANLFFKIAERYRRVEVLCRSLFQLSQNTSDSFSHTLAPYAKSRVSIGPNVIDIMGNATVASKCQSYLLGQNGEVVL